MEPAPLTTFYALGRKQAFLVMALWASAEDLHYRLAEVFYERLFERLPRMRSVSTVEMAVRQARFVSIVSAVMSHLDRPDQVRSILADAARTLAHNGVEETDYRIGALALRAACADVLEASYTQEHDAACEVLAAETIRTMLGAAAAAREPE
jgi:hemoglobin-like flavoprotein